jgi:hypothetical protein
MSSKARPTVVNGPRCRPRVGSYVPQMRFANPVESLLVKYKYVPDRFTGPNSNEMVNVYSTYYRIVYRGDGSLGFMPKADLRYVGCR